MASHPRGKVHPASILKAERWVENKMPLRITRRSIHEIILSCFGSASRIKKSTRTIDEVVQQRLLKVITRPVSLRVSMMASKMIGLMTGCRVTNRETR